MPAVPAVLLQHCAMNTWTGFSILKQGRVEMSVFAAVTAVLLHHSALDKFTDCRVVSTW